MGIAGDLLAIGIHQAVEDAFLGVGSQHLEGGGRQVEPQLAVLPFDLLRDGDQRGLQQPVVGAVRCLTRRQEGLHQQ